MKNLIIILINEQRHGTILNCYIPIDYTTNQNKGYGFIIFSKASEAAKAIEECAPIFSARFEFGKNPPSNQPAAPVNNKENEKIQRVIDNSKHQSGLFNNITNTNQLLPKRVLNESNSTMPLKKRKISEPQLPPEETNEPIQTTSNLKLF